VAERADGALVIYRNQAMSLFDLKRITRSVLKLTSLLAASLLVVPIASLAQGTPVPPATPPMIVMPPRTGTTAVPVSLDQAVRMAQNASPTAIQARGLERSDRAALRAAKGALLPQVTLSAGRVIQYGGGTTRVNSSGEQVSVTQKPVNSNGMTFNLQLFDGGQRLYDLRAARADIEAARAANLGAQYNIALNVKQQYYAVLAALESEDAAKAQLSEAQEQFKSSEAKVRAGVATMSDSLRGVVTVNNAQLALITAQTNLATANAALTRLVGSDTPVTADTASTASERFDPLPDSAALIALAENGPAVQQAQANLDAARQLRKASKSTYLPSLNATYSRSGSGVDNRFGFGNDPFTYNGRLSLGASYNLFNGFQRELNVVRADVAEDNARATLRDAQLAASSSLAGYIGSLRAAAQRVAVQAATVKASEEDVRVQQQRYNIGASTLLDLLTSQTALQQARAALISARYDYRIARAQIEALVGRTLQ
jgi:outer membrane protein